jgi:hypothetical protein
VGGFGSLFQGVHDIIGAMHHHGICRIVAFAIFAVVALGQAKPSVPSKDEIFELLSKANEKISGFEKQ